jgi:hypothetical protein
MKKIKIILVTIFAMVASTFAFLSCNTNPCSKVVCKNNGTCREGSCACPVGFEGPFCEAKISDKFIGFWDGYVRAYGGNGIGGTAPTNVTMIIAPGDSGNYYVPRKVTLYNLYSQNVPINATIFESNKINIPYQQAGLSGYFVQGTGYMESTALTAVDTIQHNYVHVYYNLLDTFGVASNYYFEGTKRTTP